MDKKEKLSPIERIKERKERIRENKERIKKYVVKSSRTGMTSSIPTGSGRRSTYSII